MNVTKAVTITMQTDEIDTFHQLLNIARFVLNASDGTDQLPGQYLGPGCAVQLNTAEEVGKAFTLLDELQGGI